MSAFARSLNRFLRVEQGEKLKRQASETGEKLKHAAKDAKKQVEKRSEGLGDKLFNILIDVKNSIFGTTSSPRTDALITRL